MVESRRYNKIPGFSLLLGSPLGCFIISLSRLFIAPRLSAEQSTRAPGPMRTGARRAADGGREAHPGTARRDDARRGVWRVPGLLHVHFVFSV